MVRKKTWEGTCIHILTTNPGIVRKTKNSFFFLLVYFVLLHFLVTLNIFSYVMSHSYLFCYESLVCIYLAHFSDREIIFLLICGHSLCIRDINLCPGKRVSWLLPQFAFCFSTLFTMSLVYGTWQAFKKYLQKAGNLTRPLLYGFLIYCHIFF